MVLVDDTSLCQVDKKINEYIDKEIKLMTKEEDGEYFGKSRTYVF